MSPAVPMVSEARVSRVTARQNREAKKRAGLRERTLTKCVKCSIQLLNVYSEAIFGPDHEICKSGFFPKGNCAVMRCSICESELSRAKKTHLLRA